MTDTNKLKEAVKESGLKTAFIADKMNLSRAGLHNKITGKTEFKASEISALIKLMDLEANDVNAIFFTK